MALDGVFNDQARDAAPERHPQHRGSGDVAAVRAGQVEPRTRAECYEALRAADGRSGQTDENQRPENPSTNHGPDPQTERFGWGRVEAEDRPLPDAIRVSPERASHILEGDEYGGGHRHGIGKPGKTEFPASWDNKKVVAAALDIAREPDLPPVYQDWNNRWLCSGTRDGVEVSVIVLPGGEVWTAWPQEGSPGVIRNPRKGRS